MALDPRAGGKTITIKEIARIADVSASTVSLVMNNKPGVGAETRYRVMKIVEALNYTPNLVARSLVKRRSYTVAMLITNTLNPIFPETAAGVDEVLKKHGYSLSVISTYDDDEVEAKEIERIKARGIDGIITSAALLDSRTLKQLARSGYPAVSLLRRVYECDELDSVIVDNVQGEYLAAEHLIRLGHVRIGVVKGPQNTSTGRERYEGAMKAFADYGVPLANELVAQGDYFKASGYAAAKKFLKMAPSDRPSAILAGNDDMALGALDAVLDAGLRVPEDLALVGYNNVETTALRAIDITTVSQRKQEMGRLAAKRLIDRIEKNKGYTKPFHIVLEPKLIVRRSCGFSISSGYVVPEKKKNIIAGSRS